ncbi:uncharacterized membrane protein (DUF485 family) [Leucobacter luti]|uniref:DUF485 domain-containing protein n=1 Tax=Leucobacter luti TaxID=340320 RepID=UPI002227DB07|nr:DUF485 domain-containing protein [Leucobacter luti]MCW2287219.1 uncharacterized membrane protein (DUF485 family) [Leucobacter luti]
MNAAVPPDVDDGAEPRSDTPIDYVAFQAHPEFQEFKHRFRRFVFPIAIAFIVWFLAFVLLAAYNHGFMATPFLGMNVGLWLGLAQFVTTFGITMWYVSFAKKRLDPASTALRAELETIAAAGASHEPPTTGDPR